MSRRKFVVEGQNVDGKKIFLRMPYHHIRQAYDPLYDDDADYNTNAKSYYDYLARFNKHMKLMTDMINRAMRRNLTVKGSKAIKFIKVGDWIDNGKCGEHDDVINLEIDLIVSKQKRKVLFENLKLKEYELSNAITVLEDGVYSPDYLPVLEQQAKEIADIHNDIKNINKAIDNINNEIKDIKKNITTINKNITNMQDNTKVLQDALQKLINNLHSAGHITTNEINNFEFVGDRKFAMGNINAFGGAMYGGRFIRTNKATTNAKNEGDIASGV